MHVGVSVRCVFKKTMQGFTAEKAAAMADGETMILTDERDNSSYQVTKIGSKVWMTQNLRIMGTISAASSNFTGNDFNVSAGDLSSGNSFDLVRSHYDGDASKGAWYNYCAASAGTVCFGGRPATADSDICPKGWRMPEYSEMQPIVNSKGNNFNVIIIGYYSNGSLNNRYSGSYWWGRGAATTNSNYSLQIYMDDWSSYYMQRDLGLSIRCVFKS